MSRIAFIAVTTSMLAGCGSITGLSGGTEFKCAASEEGVPCESISGTYTNLQAGVLPFQRRGQGGSISAPAQPVDPSAIRIRGTTTFDQPPDLPTAAAAAPGQGRLSPGDMVASHTGAPARTPERLLRIWFAPSEDADGTLNDQRYAYVMVQRGRWLIETTQENIRAKYQPIRNVSPPSAAAPSAAPKPSPQVQARQLTNDMTNRQQNAPQE